MNNALSTIFTHFIFFENAVETLGFFSHEMEKALLSCGCKVLFVDIKDPGPIPKIRCFYEKKRTLCVTFNFIAFSGEPGFIEDRQNIFEILGIPIANILVDHPLYYTKQLPSAPENMKIFCVDRGHVDFIGKYYQNVSRPFFMPLAGTAFRDLSGKGAPPLSQRTHPLIFTANYVPVDNILSQMEAVGDDYREFYLSVACDMISHPSKSLDEAFEDALFSLFPDAALDEVLCAMRGMLPIDLYVRSFYREKIIGQIADSGQKIFIVGKDWDKIKCSHPENITFTGQLDTADCLREISDSVLSLNIMPWFKQGAHDRIFSSMLNMTPVLTDMSSYLDTILTEDDDVFTFSLEKTEEIPDKIHMILSDKEKLSHVSEKAYETARSNTWESRMEQILVTF